MESRTLILFLLLLPLPAWAGGDDFGVWTEIGVQKVLPRNFTIGLEGELRTRDTSTKVDRIGLGVNAGYKLNKYVKFGVAYNFMESYKDGKTTIKYKSDGETIKNVHVTPNYWRPKHRLSVEVTPSVKVFHMLRLSLRERYQYTRKEEVSLTRYKYKYDLGTGEWPRENDPKLKEAKDSHILRSRLKLEIDKKKLKWSPFVSAETQNYFRHMELRNVRAAAGTEYKFNKRNSVNAAYVFTYYKEDAYRMHALSVGYDFKF